MKRALQIGIGIACILNGVALLAATGFAFGRFPIWKLFAIGVAAIITIHGGWIWIKDANESKKTT